MIRRWAGGFSVAMTLAPEAWGRLIEDERTQDLAVPFIGFFESDDPEFEPADDIAERLDLAAAAIPRASWSFVSWRNSAAPMASPQIRGRFRARSEH